MKDKIKEIIIKLLNDIHECTDCRYTQMAVETFGRFLDDLQVVMSGDEIAQLVRDAQEPKQAAKDSEYCAGCGYAGLHFCRKFGGIQFKPRKMV